MICCLSGDILQRTTSKRLRDLSFPSIKKCGLLAENPKLGAARPDIAPEVRYLTVGNYLILYRELSNSVEIVRVLHGARNLEAIFHKDD